MQAETSAWSISRADFPQSGSLRDQLRYLLAYAVLAPSGHNTQPWKFALGEDYVDLFAGPSRALPVVDPHDRELNISCGAALGFLEIAARGFGLACTDQLEPDANQPNHLVRVSFSGGKPASSAGVALVDAITARRPVEDVLLN